MIPTVLYWDYDTDSSVKYIDTGVDDSTVKGRFDFRLVSTTNIGTNEEFSIFTFLDDSTNLVAGVYINYDGSDYTVGSRHYNGASADRVDGDGSIKIVVGTWYTITLEYIASTSVVITVSTIGGSPDTEVNDTSDIGSRNVQRYQVGTRIGFSNAVDSGDEVVWEMDRIMGDDDTLPSACPN